METKTKSKPVRSGLERLLDDARPLVSGRRAALLVNPTAVTARLEHAADLLQSLPGTRIMRLFGPEHGIRGEAQDMISVSSERDPGSGLDVISLYGKDENSLRPGPGSLDDLDVLIYDIQDIGTRFYTFAATLALCREAAAAAGVQVLVCDRPNPLNGLAIEGGLPRPDLRSFVGWLPVPVRHGLTVGELARLYCKKARLDLDLEVLEMEGWHRDLFFDQTGLPWVMPSPNMPTPDTALVYPGMCLVEGTELSEGRGTTRPFELVGAPFLDAQELARRLRKMDLPGVLFRACSFVPTFHKHAGRSCHGVQLHVTDPRSFKPVLTGVAVLTASRSLGGALFQWRYAAYEFVTDRPAIDLLAGSPRLRKGIEAQVHPRELESEWLREDRLFREEREEFLLYG